LTRYGTKLRVILFTCSLPDAGGAVVVEGGTVVVVGGIVVVVGGAMPVIEKYPLLISVTEVLDVEVKRIR